ncbi:MAG TPA: hypothetical protein VFQ91_09825 [Bryobacteraceae bacterium]|nr:hypothetical protein [Bryobacteraceae bacterium]
MRVWPVWALGIAMWAGPADVAVARWTLAEGGRVGINSQVIADLADLPAGDFQLEMVDWVAVNAVPEDLERMTGLRRLRELRLPGPLWNRNADGGKDLSRLLKFLAPVATLEKLTFSDHFLDRIRFRDAGLEEIAGLQGMRELALRQAEVKGPGLRHFPNLESLDVTLCPMPDLQALAGMRHLRRLWAGDTFITDLAPLAAMTRMEDLDLHGTGIRDESLIALAGMQSLRRLDLQGTALTDAAAEQLARLTNLESLNLYRTKISNAGLEKLRTLRKLRQIDIRYTRVTASGVEVFRAALPQARVQFAGGAARHVSKIVPPDSADAGVLAAWIRSLGGSERPEDGYVSLRGIPLPQAAVVALARMPGLRTLDLEATDLGDSALPALAAIPTLEELSLNSTQVSDAGLAALARLPRLRRLRLNNTYVEGDGFAQWPAGSGLEELTLLGTPASDSGMAGVARLARLRHLVLAESDVTSAGIALVAGLQLVSLDAAAADVGDEAPWERLRSLRSLVLRDTRITDASLRKLTALHALESLDLARTRLTNAGIETLSRLTNLRKLDLAYADLDDKGLAGLRSLAALESLRLDSTNITDAAVDTLLGFGKLRELDLYHSLLTGPAVQRLRDARAGLQILWDKEAGLPHRRRA